METRGPSATLSRRVRDRLRRLSGLLILLASLPALGQSRSLNLAATDEWLGTDIQLLPGDRVTIEASGRWSNYNGRGFRIAGPDGFENEYDPPSAKPDAQFAALIGRVGSDGQPFLIGREFTGTPRGSGMLQLAMNDRPGTYGDNWGELKIDIRVFRAPIPMPDVHGLAAADAKQRIREAFGGRLDLPITTRSSPSDLPAGSVTSQRPQVGSDLRTAVRIDLLLAEQSAPPALPQPPTADPPSPAQSEIDALKDLIRKQEGQLRTFETTVRGLREENARLKDENTRLARSPRLPPAQAPKMPILVFAAICGLLTTALAASTLHMRRKLRWMERLRVRSHLEPAPRVSTPSRIPRLPEYDFDLRCRVESGNAGPLGEVPIIDPPEGTSP